MLLLLFEVFGSSKLHAPERLTKALRTDNIPFAVSTSFHCNAMYNPKLADTASSKGDIAITPYTDDRIYMILESLFKRYGKASF